jgi:RNA polymerase sigma factor (sigma-70 family)
LGQTTEAGVLLDRLRAGDPSARDLLIALAQERFVALARAMLRRYPHVRRWEETDDLLQAALVRLHRSLAEVRPEDVTHFDNLAAVQIRRELIDLARHYYGPRGLGANHATHGPEDSDRQPLHEGADHSEPGGLAEWCELHEKIEQLPAEQREVVELLFYQGLPQAGAAEILGVTVRTVQRRWHAALVQLHDLMKGQWPDLS